MWDRQFGDKNVAIVLPTNVIGIDIDAYKGHDGAETLEELERDLGPLPPTYFSSARQDGVSGIYMFRVPDDVTWPGKAGPGIDIINWRNRYAICYPSWHNGVKDIYRWWQQTPDGQMPAEFPDPDTFPKLPQSWIDYLGRECSSQDDRIKVSNLGEWLAQFDDGDMCRQMRDTLDRYRNELNEAATGGGIHDAMNDGINALVGDAAQGCVGLEEALGKLRAVFLRMIGTRDRSRKRMAADEWKRSLIGAAEKHPDIKHGDRCPGAESFKRGEMDHERKRRQTLLTGYRTGDWLDGQRFKPLHYAIPHLVPEGLTLVAGPPKAGKSVLLLKAGIEAARAGEMFGLSIDGHDVFYLALEDSDRRMQSRCRELLDGDPIPPGFGYQLAIKPGKLIDTVAAWLYDHDQGIVLIDTLGRALERPKAGETQYDRDYRIVVTLKAIADASPGSAVVVSHHSRKANADDWLDTVSGTNAIAGGCDTIIVLNRQRSAQDGMLRITGRDVEESEYAILLERPLGWHLDGDDLLEAASKANENRRDGRTTVDVQAVLEFVNGNLDGVDRAQVAEAVGITPDHASITLKRQWERGNIRKIRRGVYGPVQKQRLASRVPQV
jgi:hypothetical protein